MTKYCLGFMFNKNETDVLLIQKTKPAWQFGKFNGIGGKLEKDETPYGAMVREFKEETGLDSPLWKEVVKMYGDDWEVYVFTCKSDDVFDYKQMEGEEPNLLPLAELDKYDLIDNLNWLIPMCLDKNINYKVSNVEFKNVKPTNDMQCGVGEKIA